MKESIIGYITAMIDEHIRADKRAKTIAESDVTKIFNKRAISRLEDLLDYVADFKEDTKGPITIVLNNNLEVETLKKRIRELETSCENDCEVIKNLHMQIKEVKEDNFTWQHTCNLLREKLESLEENE